MNTIINTSITVIVSALLGVCFTKIKEYKNRLENKNKEGEMLKTALMSMLQSDLTNTYFVYEKIGAVPDYVYKNWCNSKMIYEELGGNDYIHVLDEKMKSWKITKTDILR